MIKKQIKLFFEDDIVPHKVNSHTTSESEIFAKLIVKHLSNRYDVSDIFGKIGQLGGTDSKLMDLYFRSTYDGISITPANDVRRKNISSAWSLPPVLEENEVPFFVIDTDGLAIDNITSRIMDIDGQISKHPSLGKIVVSGRPPLLCRLLQDSSNFSGNWGLVLLNPNQEGTNFRSLIINHKDLECIMFKTANENYLGFNWLHKGGQKHRFFNKFDNFRWKETQLRFVQDIWNNIHNVQTSFSSSISKDISEFHDDIIQILENADYADPIPHLSMKRNARVNAQKTLFSIFIKKQNKKMPKTILNRFSDSRSSGGVDIRYLEFGNEQS